MKFGYVIFYKKWEGVGMPFSQHTFGTHEAAMRIIKALEHDASLHDYYFWAKQVTVED